MENKTLRVEFKCPCEGCDGREVEEVLYNVIQFSNIDTLATFDDGDDPALDYGSTAYDGDDARVDRFCCVSCGKSLKNESGSFFSSTTELYEWLKSRDMLEEIE